MLESYLPILVLIGIAFAFALGSVVMSRLIGTKKPSEVKLAPYECGMPLIGTAQERFSIKFYIIAMLFILFDIEAVFLYPWAVASRGKAGGIDQAVASQWVECRNLVFAGVMLFIALLVAGFAYDWRKGVFKWR